MSKFGTINYPHEVFTKQAWLATLTSTIISRMTTASFESLSGDVLLEIAGLLSRPDILHLSLTVRFLGLFQSNYLTTISHISRLRFMPRLSVLFITS